jgi:MinD-like ATPase involved in chromosome partitioning or flagellar assembly
MHPTSACEMNIVSINPKSPQKETQSSAEGVKAKVIAITSGKGGVGKTHVTINLAIALAKQGSRVCIFDADTSLANINVVIGLTPRYTIEHLLSGERTVEEILLEGPQGVMIIPAASGIAECANLDRPRRDRLIEALKSLETSFDYLLIDTAAGISDMVLDFVQSAQYMILVISTEPTSLTDAFALLRVLKRRDFHRPAHVLVNMALNYANSMEVFKRFEAAVRKYLGMKVHYLGYITEDKAIKLATGQQRPVILSHPEALASRCFTTLAAVLSKQFVGPPEAQGFSDYWSMLLATGHDGAATAAGAPAPSPVAAAAAIDRPIDHVEPSIGAPTGQAVFPRPREAIERKPADVNGEILSLATRLHELLNYPGIDLAGAEHLLAPLVDLYQKRFQPVPPPGVTEEPREMRDGGELRRKYAQLLEDYRTLAARLDAEEALLHETLLAMYELINREMAARAPS